MYSRNMHIKGPYPFIIAGTFDAQNGSAEPIPATPAQTLIAGQVSDSIEFEEAEVATLHPLQLYSRVADRVEAATRLATGQRLNIRV